MLQWKLGDSKPHEPVIRTNSIGLKRDGASFCKQRGFPSGFFGRLPAHFKALVGLVAHLSELFNDILRTEQSLNELLYCK